jgi:hypothetical protein
VKRAEKFNETEIYSDKIFVLNGKTLEIRLDKTNGLLLSELKIPQSKDLIKVNSRVSMFLKGIHNLIVVLEGSNQLDIDWIGFTNELP